MKEHPILFKPEMVRAILEGKTQTRRIIAIPPEAWLLGQDARSARFGSSIPQDDPCPVEVRFPYGPGDRLWVRETWAYHLNVDREETPEMLAWAREHRAVWYRASSPDAQTGCGGAAGKWRPSIFMPRWAARLELEVVKTRVERLHDITAQDIVAEGAVERRHDDGMGFGPCPVSAFDGKVYLDLLSLWAAGWDRINGKRAPFASNPWVRVIEFFRRAP